MRIKVDDKIITIENCTSFNKRLIGFMFQRKKISFGKCFPNCNSVHTFFMKQNLDIILCDENNIVKFVYLNVSKNKIIGPKKGIKYIYELPIGTGEKIQINKIIPIEKEL